MRIVNYGAGDGTPCVLLLGYFDGVHVGHRALISFAAAHAREYGCGVAVMTFRGAKNGGQIYTLSERCSIFAELGADLAYVADYGSSFRETSGTDFLQQVCADLDVRAFVCGEDFTYGRGAACTARDLAAFASARHLSAFVRPLLSCGGEKAAASRAKELLAAGDIPALTQLLGDRYRKISSAHGRICRDSAHGAGRISRYRQLRSAPHFRRRPHRAGSVCGRLRGRSVRCRSDGAVRSPPARRDQM